MLRNDQVYILQLGWSVNATVSGLHDEYDIDLYAFLLNEGVSALSQLRR